MKEQEVINSIEKIYGFKKELIKNVEICGLWHVRFTVNSMKYYGCITFAGAEPLLEVEGYTYQYYWHKAPVTEEYYNKFIKGKIISLKRCVDAESGEWEWMEKTFTTEEAAETYIKTLDNSFMYDYDIKL